ncbi:unnamed protein product [Periconia digitata]|uniref:Uncharacterized protein n=1 Tax=Periconia digitata TaxID=1303443 RepID=A0A9W4UWH3_9PLEO|nr:unnamed protein product [Periconia digitata]
MLVPIIATIAWSSARLDCFPEPRRPAAEHGDWLPALIVNTISFGEVIPKEQVRVCITHLPTSLDYTYAEHFHLTACGVDLHSTSSTPFRVLLSAATRTSLLMTGRAVNWCRLFFSTACTLREACQGQPGYWIRYPYDEHLERRCHSWMANLRCSPVEPLLVAPRLTHLCFGPIYPSPLVSTYFRRMQLRLLLMVVEARPISHRACRHPALCLAQRP